MYAHLTQHNIFSQFCEASCCVFCTKLVQPAVKIMFFKNATVFTRPKSSVTYCQKSQISYTLYGNEDHFNGHATKDVTIPA